MTNNEAVNWIINISADIGKAEHRDLWHYEQALAEIREMLETAQPNLQQTCNQLATDTIYRQDAIDIVHQTIYQFFDVADDDDEDTPMSERDKLLLTVNKAISNNIKAIMPAKTETVTAQWIDDDPAFPVASYKKKGMSFFCSNCLHRAGKHKHNTYKYCPWCGAKMTEGE